MTKVTQCIILIICITIPLYSQWFDSQTVNATILLEKRVDGVFVPHGTGFVIYNYKNPEYPIVVTCEHVLRNEDIYVTVNADSNLIADLSRRNIDSIVFVKRTWILKDGKLRCRVPLTRTPTPSYVIHPTLDIGAFLIDIGAVTIDNFGNEYKVCDIKTLPQSRTLKRSEVSLGTETYFVGFPYGIGAKGSINPLIRSGSVAWIQDGLNEFLMDAISFSGNSGSPIFTKGTQTPKPNVIGWQSPYLIGMVIGHLGESIEGVITQPNEKVNIIQRTNIETQNWGLARCLWYDDIEEVVMKAKNLEMK